MTKKLYRSKQNKVIAGICGGIGNYFDIDPIIIRILLVVAAFSGGVGLLVYFIAWIIIPKEEINYQEINTQPNNVYQQTTSSFENVNNENLSSDSKSNSKYFFGYALIIIGALILFDDYVNLLNFKYIFPIILIISGLYLIINKGRKNEN